MAADQSERGTPPSTGDLTAQLQGLLLSTPPQDRPLKQVLELLDRAFGSDASVALLFNDVEHSLRVAEESALSDKQRDGMESFYPRLFEANTKERHRLPLKSYGTVFVFSELEAQKRGCNSALVYYLARSDRFLAALVLCRDEGEFDKETLRALDSVASLIGLLAENEFYKERSREADGLVNLDGLTGLFNHRYFQESLANELLKSQRYYHPVSLLLVDVDHFKDINDRYGHPQGDEVLREIAQILKATVRAYDVAVRYGGEEFGVVLPHSDQGQAHEAAERLRRAVEHHAFPGQLPGEPLRLTVSVGVATCPVNAKTKAELIDRADQALYLAKSEGRNRVCLSLTNSSEPIRVGFCPAALNNAYYRAVLAGMEDVTREIKQIELTVRAPERETDYRVLPDLFRDFAQAKLDAVAICTQSPAVVSDLCILHEADIPTFFFNVPEEIADPKVRSYVGYDQTEAGETVGSYLGRVLRGSGRVAVLEGLSEPTNRLRVGGFIRALSAFPDITVVASESAEWLRDRAHRVTAELLDKHENLDAIFAASDAMALGAVEAARAAGKLGRIFIIGLDGTRDALLSIKRGELTATLHTDPREMGRILLRTMVRGLIRQEHVPRHIDSPIHIVTKENVEHALNPMTRWRSLVPPPGPRGTAGI